jgi:hypothetical protein
MMGTLGPNLQKVASISTIDHVVVLAELDMHWETKNVKLRTGITCNWWSTGPVS